MFLLVFPVYGGTNVHWTFICMALSARCQNGRTAVHYASSCGGVEALAWLRSNGADMMVSNAEG